MKINYQEALKQPSVWALIIANVVPFFGVLFYSWSLFAVIFLYWLENVIVGIFNVLRMHRAEGPVDPKQNTKLNGKPYVRASRIVLIVFFCFHYGLFTFVHGVFVVVLFRPFDLDAYTFLIGASALVLSHAVSYFTNFIGKGEYRNVSENMLFIQPYKRIVILHISIIAGGILTKLLGAPILALLFFIVLKTWIDIWAHVQERALLVPQSIVLQ